METATKVGLLLGAVFTFMATEFWVTHRLSLLLENQGNLQLNISYLQMDGVSLSWNQSQSVGAIIKDIWLGQRNWTDKTTGVHITTLNIGRTEQLGISAWSNSDKNITCSMNFTVSDMIMAGYLDIEKTYYPNEICRFNLKVSWWEQNE